MCKNLCGPWLNAILCTKGPAIRIVLEGGGLCSANYVCQYMLLCNFLSFTKILYFIKVTLLVSYTLLAIDSLSLKPQSHSWSRMDQWQTRFSFVRAFASRNWTIFRGSRVEITNESRSRMNHAWNANVSLTITDKSLTYRERRRIRTNMVQYSTNIRHTPDVWITDGEGPNTQLRVRSTYKHFRSAHALRINH